MRTRLCAVFENKARAVLLRLYELKIAGRGETMHGHGPRGSAGARDALPAPADDGKEQGGNRVPVRGIRRPQQVASRSAPAAQLPAAQGDVGARVRAGERDEAQEAVPFASCSAFQRFTTPESMSKRSSMRPTEWFTMSSRDSGLL